MQTRGRATPEVQATQTALDRLGTALSVGLFVVAGLSFLVPYAGQGLALRTASFAVCVAGAIGMWRVRSADRPFEPALNLLIPPLVVVALAAVQIIAGAASWWLPLEIAALGAVMATAAMHRIPASTALAAVTIVVSVAPGLLLAPMGTTDEGLVFYRLEQLVIAYVITAVGAAVLLRVQSTAGNDREVSRRELMARADGQTQAVARMSVRRVLHDTVLNTLETVANGVPEEQWPQLRRRCTADLRTLESIPDVAAARELADLVSELHHVGVAIDADVKWLGDPPPLVKEAVLAATAEAIRNAARHSGTDRVLVRGRVTVDAVFVEVVDSGVGLAGTSSDRLGVRTSIVASMDAVSGHAFVDSQPGVGTRISLVWDADKARVASALSGMRLRLQRVFAMAATVSLAAFTISALVDPGLQWPLWRLCVIGVAGTTILVLLRSAMRGNLGRGGLMLALAGLALVVVLLPLSDPRCASLQSSYPFDLRAVLMAAIALSVITWRGLAASVVVLLLASGMANLLWINIGSTCGWTYLLISCVAASIGIAAFWFARTMDEQGRSLARQVLGHEQAMFADAQREARTRELSSWKGIEVAEAAAVLERIASGEPDSPSLRRRARTVAQQVRQWLLLLGTSGPVPIVLADLLQHFPWSPALHLEGDPRAVDDDSLGAQQAAQRLADWIPQVPGAAVRVTVSRTGDTASVLVHSDRPGACEDPEEWSDEDGWWLHLP